MPELPEVETMRRGILGIVGATVHAAARTPCRKQPISISPRIDRLNRRLQGQTIVDVERLGKRVVVVVESADRLIFEPRMTGLVLIDAPPTTEHLRFELQLEDSAIDRLLFWDRRGLGRIALLSPADYQSKLSDGSLGPDALSVDAIEFRSRFKNSRREIKVSLLDQAAIAGVGNLYASEILHLAGIHPQSRCHRLSVKQWGAIHTCMRAILQKAIQYEGSTLSDGTYRNALNESGSYQNEHQVYDRAGQPCRYCGQSIQRIVQAQRSTFFCARCQSRRGIRPQIEHG